MAGFPSLADHLLVLLFGWGLPLLSSLQGRRALDSIVFSEPVRRRFYLSNSLMLALFAGIILLAWHAQGRPFAEMGFRPPTTSPDVDTAILLTLVLMAAYAADLWRGIRRAHRHREDRTELLGRTPFLPRHVRELPLYVLMCASAGVFEEIIYRGFMVTYFLPEPNGRSGWPWLAVTAPAFLFGMAHHYQGWQAMGKVMLLSLLLALVFILGGSLYWVMAVHFGIDLSAGIATMAVMRQADGDDPVSMDTDTEGED
ncbi:MAG: CPBP family intramembrane metalloprotease [Chitinophagia bacterium]|nr:CPBP family intramembrane metalloprotease [Chitinophagia bacterium]